MGDSVEVARHGTIAVVALNRPKVFNALDLEMLSILAEKMVVLANDVEVRGVVIVGRGKAFCAGGDLRKAEKHPGGPGAAFHAMAGRFNAAVVEIRRMAKPVVAALNGVAAGGGFSLALACDFRVMDQSSKLIQAYTSSGLCIDGGGTFVLPRIVGLARALEIVAFDEPISAKKAREWGLANSVTEDGQALSEATKILNALEERSLHSFSWSKRLLNDSYHRSFEAQIEKEREGLFACGNHPDGQEGIRAFIEKRKPAFG